jgi:WD40 repeat protein
MLMHLLSGHTDSILNIAISQNNEFIVSGSKDSTIRIWDIDNGNEIKVI